MLKEFCFLYKCFSVAFSWLADFLSQIFDLILVVQILEFRWCIASTKITAILEYANFVDFLHLQVFIALELELCPINVRTVA